MKFYYLFIIYEAQEINKNNDKPKFKFSIPKFQSSSNTKFFNLKSSITKSQINKFSIMTIV